MIYYKNKKTGNVYLMFSAAWDSTNAREGEKVIIYYGTDQYMSPTKEVFVREEKEFFEKFEVLPYLY